MSGNLQHKKILVTRGKNQATHLVNLLEQHSGVVLHVPLISIQCISHDISKLQSNRYEWIFFTSVNGVRCFMKQRNAKALLKNCRIAAVGSKTAEKINQYGLDVHFIPSTYNAETMVEEFLNLYPQGNHLLLIRGNISRNVLIDAFKRENISYEPVVVYETRPNVSMKETLINTIKFEQPDVLTFTSPSTVNTFVTLLDGTGMLEEVRKLPTVCIGTTTENSARNHQFTTLITPETFTIEAMVDKLIHFINSHPIS